LRAVQKLKQHSKSSRLQAEKKILLWGVDFFGSDVICGGLLPGLGSKPLDGSILLKFLLEIKLQFESFDTLDDLLGFQVQKLRSKLNRILD